MLLIFFTIFEIFTSHVYGKFHFDFPPLPLMNPAACKVRIDTHATLKALSRSSKPQTVPRCGSTGGLVHTRPPPFPHIHPIAEGGVVLPAGKPVWGEPDGPASESSHKPGHEHHRSNPLILNRVMSAWGLEM